MGNQQGTNMETMSLKSLAVKILAGNQQGNQTETKSFLGEKLKGNQETTQETRAKGYGCGACGNKIYQAVQTWEMSELPTGSPGTHEHRLVTHWQCEQCKAVYEIIGGSKEPQPIN